MLEELVPARFGLLRPGAVVEAIHFGRLHTDSLRELPPLVFAAAGEGDGPARGIIDRLADEVVAMAGAAIRRLRLVGADADVVLGGGVFRNDDATMMGRIRDGVRAVAPGSRVTRLNAPPLVGAVLLGLDRLGANRATMERVRDRITHDRLSGERERAGGV